MERIAGMGEVLAAATRLVKRAWMAARAVLGRTDQGRPPWAMLAGAGGMLAGLGVEWWRLGPLGWIDTCASGNGPAALLGAHGPSTLGMLLAMGATTLAACRSHGTWRPTYGAALEAMGMLAAMGFVHSSAAVWLPPLLDPKLTLLLVAVVMTAGMLAGGWASAALLALARPSRRSRLSAEFAQ